LLFACLANAQDKARIPEIPPDLPELQFSEEGGRWPPQLEGVTDLKILETQPVYFAITPALKARLAEVALQSDAMRRTLGKRFAFMGAELVEAAKIEEGQRPPEQRDAIVTFYSYDRNVAVQALVRDGEILNVEERSGFQPPETEEEVAAATRLALQDSRLKAVSDAYEPRGLITEAGEGERNAGNRLIYISFERRGTAVAEYFALVDLTLGEVLDAGPVAGSQ
jgi:hypothetical protein